MQTLPADRVVLETGRSRDLAEYPPTDRPG
jgi:hypothetical protein